MVPRKRFGSNTYVPTYLIVGRSTSFHTIESDEDETIHIPGVVGCTRRFALVDSFRS